MNPFVAFLEELRPQVESTLERLLPSPSTPPERLHEAMRYSLLVGGKRVRPALVVLCGEALGASRRGLLPAAAAVEMVHTFSLVHDDLPALDDDDLRRGQPTVHKRYDEALAVLVGDALLNLGLGTLARHPETASPAVRLRATLLVTEAVGSSGMIGGQVADLEAERTPSPPDPSPGSDLRADLPPGVESVLESIHRRKTGALIAASVRLGGLYAGADAATDRALDRLGHGLGLMFQIADDILDVEGSTATLGKTAGKDAEAQKLTYPRVYGLEASRAKLQAVRDETLEVLRSLPVEGELLEALITFLSTRDR